jgi:hypothetical protein
MEGMMVAKTEGAYFGLKLEIAIQSVFLVLDDAVIA